MKFYYGLTVWCYLLLNSQKMRNVVFRLKGGAILNTGYSKTESQTTCLLEPWVQPIDLPKDSLAIILDLKERGEVKLLNWRPSLLYSIQIYFKTMAYFSELVLLIVGNRDSSRSFKGQIPCLAPIGWTSYSAYVSDQLLKRKCRICPCSKLNLDSYVTVFLTKNIVYLVSLKRHMYLKWKGTVFQPTFINKIFQLEVDKIFNENNSSETDYCVFALLQCLFLTSML